MIPKLFYAGASGDGSGWGVCNRNLIRELGKLSPDFRSLDDLELSTPQKYFAAQFPEHIVFMPIADHGLNPSMEIRGWKNIGYTFFEYPLEPKAAKNAKQYDLIFCGSTWCQERLAERGIKSKVLIQGVDHKIFKPGPVRPSDGETWIFSGGKFEYRKGQDLVLAAFKEVLKTHPKTKLITTWQNPWPQSLATMRESKHIRFELFGGTWGSQLGHLCEINGIPRDRVLTLPGVIPNREMANIYRQCDFGVFPNRCEGGTNLVMMEFMACGKAVVANTLTGHADLTFSKYLIRAMEDAQHWAKMEVEQIAIAMMAAIKTVDALPERGECNAHYMRQWTWERAARTIVENL